MERGRASLLGRVRVLLQLERLIDFLVRQVGCVTVRGIVTFFVYYVSGIHARKRGELLSVLPHKIVGGDRICVRVKDVRRVPGMYRMI
jgi:hypothetical protein